MLTAVANTLAKAVAALAVVAVLIAAALATAPIMIAPPVAAADVAAAVLALLLSLVEHSVVWGLWLVLLMFVAFHAVWVYYYRRLHSKK